MLAVYSSTNAGQAKERASWQWRVSVFLTLVVAMIYCPLGALLIEHLVASFLISLHLHTNLQYRGGAFFISVSVMADGIICCEAHPAYRLIGYVGRK
jgi:hypothetical protein